MRRLVFASVFCVGLASVGTLGQTQTPRPFPGAGTPPAGGEKPPSVSSGEKPTPSGAPQGVAPAPAAGLAGSASDPMLTGAPIYPTAEWLDSYDAGRGQRYFIFGSTSSFLDVVTYYKNMLKNGGREFFKTPAMHQFDLARFDEDTMAYPPSVVVKDYTWNGSTGYLVVKNRQEKRFPTVIQIVPR